MALLPDMPTAPGEAPPAARTAAPRARLAAAATWARRRVGLLAVWLVAAVALVDYATRCARVITRDDPAELQVLALAGGIPHGTSYPLYVWLVRLFVKLPLGPIAFRFNLFSSLCGALTLVALGALVALFARREGTRAWLAGAFAAGVFAVGHSFTQVSIFTGMYTLHTLMAFAGLFFFARWVVGRGGRREGRDVQLALGLFGAMLANHIMTLALYPGVLALLVWTGYHDKTQRWAIAKGVAWGAAAVLTLDVFLYYLLWRNHVHYDHWASIVAAPKFFDVRPDQASSFWYSWWYEVTCRQFRFDVTGATWAQRSGQLGLIFPRLSSELSPVVVALAIGGVGRLYMNDRRLWTLVALVIFMHLYLATGYTATLKTHIYLLPVTGLTACLAGYGALPLLAFARAKLGLRRHASPAFFAATVLLGLAAVPHPESRALFKHVARRHPSASTLLPLLAERPDEHDESATLDEARLTVDGLPPRALVFAGWSIAYAIQFVGRFERGTHDLEVYEPKPYGVGHWEFPVDYVERITDPHRTVPVFFQGDIEAPVIPGYTPVRRTPQLVEMVRQL